MLTIEDVLKALLAFFLSGVVGALLQQWLSRAKPMFVISSIGFQGSEEFIKIPDSLVLASKDIAWVRILNPYITFENLIVHHKHTCGVIQRLEKAIPAVEDWINKYGSSQSKQNAAMSFEELKKHPYMNIPTVGSAIDGGIRRNEYREVPIRLDMIQSFERIADLSFSKEGWRLDLDEKVIVFPIEGVEEGRKKDMELCAESFARGVLANVAYYTYSFVNASNRELRKLNEFRRLLEETLLPNSYVSVDLSIYNSGKSAVAIRPHMGLKILHEKFRGKALVLAIRKPKKHDLGDPSDDLQKEEVENLKRRSGQEELVESFLPETSASPYVSVSPGEMKEITLIAADPLGKENIESLKQIYQTGLLTCKVLGITLDGKEVWTKPTVFSNEINAGDREKLKKMVVNG